MTAIQDTNTPTDIRKKLIEDINSQYDDYLPNLIDEKDTTEELAKAREEANKKFMDTIILTANEEKLGKIIKENQDIFDGYGDAIVSTADAQNKVNETQKINKQLVDEINTSLGTNMDAQEALDFVLEKQNDLYQQGIENQKAYGEQDGDVREGTQKTAEAQRFMNDMMTDSMRALISNNENLKEYNEELFLATENEALMSEEMNLVTEELNNAQIAYDELNNRLLQNTEIKKENKDQDDKKKRTLKDLTTAEIKSLKDVGKQQFANFKANNVVTLRLGPNPELSTDVRELGDYIYPYLKDEINKVEKGINVPKKREIK